MLERSWERGIPSEWWILRARIKRQCSCESAYLGARISKEMWVCSHPGNNTGGRPVFGFIMKIYLTHGIQNSSFAALTRDICSRNTSSTVSRYWTWPFSCTITTCLFMNDLRSCHVRLVGTGEYSRKEGFTPNPTEIRKTGLFHLPLWKRNTDGDGVVNLDIQRACLSLRA